MSKNTITTLTVLIILILAGFFYYFFMEKTENQNLEETPSAEESRNVTKLEISEEESDILAKENEISLIEFEEIMNEYKESGNISGCEKVSQFGLKDSCVFSYLLTDAFYNNNIDFCESSQTVPEFKDACLDVFSREKTEEIKFYRVEDIFMKSFFVENN